MPKELRPFYNVGPGEIIQDSLDALGWQQDDLADLTGLTAQTINKLIQNKQSITVETAQLLAKVFDTSAELWLNLDTAHQLRKHQMGERENLAGKKAQMRKYMPLVEMRKKGWMLYDNTLEGLIHQCQRYFGADDVPEEMYAESEAFCARRSKSDEDYTAWYSKTWYLTARIHAEKFDLPPFDRERLVNLSVSLISWTVREDGIAAFLEELQNCGVGFFVLSHLQKTYLDGAAFMCGEKPFIVYTGRYNRIDNFWFTVAHEMAHVLNHLDEDGKPILDNLDNTGLSEVEREADKMASDYLHESQILEEGRKIGQYLTAKRLSNLCTKVGVSVTVALGILQHNKVLEWRQFAKYKETVLDRIPAMYKKG